MTRQGLSVIEGGLNAREVCGQTPPPSPPLQGEGKKATHCALLAALIALLLTACARPPVVIDSGCHAYRVIRPSRADTTETLRQVLSHNQTWRARCMGRQK